MELRDYLQMLRRGWPTVVVSGLLGLIAALGYLSVTPQQFQATATVLIVPDRPGTLTDLQLGTQFTVTAAPTYADLIESEVILAPAAEAAVSPADAQTFAGLVTATAREGTSLIDIVATGGSGAEAAMTANEVATSAATVIPALSRAGSSAGTALVDIQVVGVAVDPGAPVSPVASRILTLGVIIGLLLGLAVAITRQSLDTTLRRPDDLRASTSVPLLTTLPRLGRKHRNGVVVRDRPSSPAVETYRSLRTNLSHLGTDDRRSLLFTAVSTTRGNAEVPVNLAWSMAQGGRSVLLVDLDLRQSPISALLELRGPGVSEVLADGVEMFDAIQVTSQPGLDVMPAGDVRGNPSDLLSGASMAELLRLAEKHYEVVVLHAPPVLSYTDAAVVSRMAGHTLVVVTAGTSRVAQFRSALSVLGNVRVQPLGLVLTESRMFRADKSTVQDVWARRRSGAHLSRRQRSDTDGVKPSGRRPGERATSEEPGAIGPQPESTVEASRT